MFQIKFWGVRGSLPTAGPEYSEFGGASCCVSVQLNDSFIIFDAGTGIYPLGRWLIEKDIKQTHLFLSHLHFDHIIGLPFFAPFWQQDHIVNLYSSEHEGSENLENFLEQVISPPLFPVSLLKTAQSDIILKDVSPGDSIEIEQGILIETIPLNHPGEAIGFKLSSKGKSVCYITDTEHPNEGHDQLIIEFIEGTDCLIYDATFNTSQHEAHKGWGHSTWEEAIYVARKGNAKSLFIYHHKPENDDQTMQNIENQAQEIFANTIVARQGMTFDLN